MIKEFELTIEELDQLIAAILAAQRAPQMLVGGTLPPSPQEAANAGWAEVGIARGFKPMTVKPVEGKSNRFFTAEVIDESR